eukprot:8131971-Pyramimonas_sp.AAC.1
MIRKLTMVGKFPVTRPNMSSALQRYYIYCTSHQIKRMQGNMQMHNKIPAYNNFKTFAEDIATVVSATFAQDPPEGDIEAIFPPAHPFSPDPLLSAQGQLCREDREEPAGQSQREPREVDRGLRGEAPSRLAQVARYRDGVFGFVGVVA